MVFFTWLVNLVRSGGVFRATLPFALSLGAASSLAHLAYKAWGWQLIGEIHSLLLFLLAVLLLAIVNSAITVYRDGRQSLGAVTNSLRDLSRQIVSFLDNEKDHKMLERWIILSMRVLRLELGHKYNAALLRDWATNAEVEELKKTVGDNRFLTVVTWISQRLSQLEHEGKISVDHRISMGLNLHELIVGYGSCRRVQAAQLPLDFHLNGELAIAVFCLSLPFVYVAKTDLFGVIAATTIVSYFLFGMLQQAIQSKDPYGDDQNDLPMDAIADAAIEGIQAIFRTKLPSDLGFNSSS